MNNHKMKVLERLQAGEITAAEAMDLLKQLPEQEAAGNGPASPLEPSPFDAQDGGGFVEWLTGLFGSGWTKNKNPQRIEFSSAPITQQISGLSLKGKNGSVKIESGHTGHIKIYCEYMPRSSKKEQAIIEFKEEDGRYEIAFPEETMRAVRVYCQVPKVFVSQINALTSNAKIRLEDVKAGSVKLLTSNASIKAEKVEAEEIKLLSSNGSVKLENVQSQKADLCTSNASVRVEKADIVHLRMSTANASIKAENLRFGEEAEYSLEAATSNASISVYVPKNVGVKVDASTSHAKVACELPDMRFGEMSKNYFKGENQQYAQGQKRLSMKLNTTNASVKIKED